MEPGGRIDQWVQRARESVEEWRDTLPTDVSVDIIFDQNEYTNERLSGLVFNLLGALVIVLLVRPTGIMRGQSI